MTEEQQQQQNRKAKKWILSSTDIWSQELKQQGHYENWMFEKINGDGIFYAKWKLKGLRFERAHKTVHNKEYQETHNWTQYIKT